jgi:hypothetical protein
MSAEQESGALSAERQQACERAIERQIMQRTWGRIQALEVKVSHDRVIVRGRAPSYYVEQLVLQGVLDLIESVGTMRIELNIQVASPRSWAREALESCVAAGDGVTPIRNERRSAK